MNSNPEAIETIALQLQRDLSAMKDAKDGQEHLLVTTLSRTFGVDINEVALYRLDHERSVLKFLWPERLKSIGAIPFSSFDSLAARTARGPHFKMGPRCTEAPELYSLGVKPR